MIEKGQTAKITSPYFFNVGDISPFKHAYKVNQNNKRLSEVATPRRFCNKIYEDSKFGGSASHRDRKHDGLYYKGSSNSMIEPIRVQVNIQTSEYSKSERKYANLHSPYMPYERKILLNKSKLT